MSQICYLSSLREVANDPNDFECIIPYQHHFASQVNVQIKRISFKLEESVPDVICCLQCNLYSLHQQTLLNGEAAENTTLFCINQENTQVTIQLQHSLQFSTSRENLMKARFRMFALETGKFLPIVKSVSDPVLVHVSVEPLNPLKQHHLIIHSNDAPSLSHFPENSCDSFYFYTNDQIELKGGNKWKMKLLSAHFSHQFQTLSEDNSFSIIVQQIHLDDDLEDLDINDLIPEDLEVGAESIKTIIPKPGFYDTPRKLAVALSEAFQSSQILVDCTAVTHTIIIKRGKLKVFEKDLCTSSFSSLFTFLVGATGSLKDVQLELQDLEVAEKVEEKINSMFQSNTPYQCKVVPIENGGKLIFDSNYYFSGFSVLGTFIFMENTNVVP